jgi:hypothetical protein
MALSPNDDGHVLLLSDALGLHCAGQLPQRSRHRMPTPIVALDGIGGAVYEIPGAAT